MAKDKSSKQKSAVLEVPVAVPVQAELKKKKRKIADAATAADEAQPALVEAKKSKKSKKSKVQQPASETAAAVQSAASAASAKKQHKKAEAAAEATPQVAVTAAAEPTGKKQKKNKKAAAADRLTEAAPNATKPAAAAEHSLEPSKKKSKKHKKELENGMAVAAPAEPVKPKKEKKKAKAAKLELAAVLPPATDAPGPAQPAQAVAVAMPPEAVEELAEAVQDANGGPIHIVTNSKSPGGGRAFQRVKAEEWIGKQGAINNSYQATFGEDGWGAKAQQVLGQVRGKDFRHEKTKKKRGTYKGGLIDSKVNSFKYDSD